MVTVYLERFLANVSDSELEECWLWNGSKRGAGYGQCSKHVHPSRIASRAMYELCNGPIHDAWVLHTCDNVLCVNPSHLVLGTPKDNTHDMMRKGRFGRHAEGRSYNTSQARVRLKELYSDAKFRRQQGERIAAGQQRNVRRFAFGSAV